MSDLHPLRLQARRELHPAPAEQNDRRRPVCRLRDECASRWQGQFQIDGVHGEVADVVLGGGVELEAVQPAYDREALNRRDLPRRVRPGLRGRLRRRHVDTPGRDATFTCMLGEDFQHQPLAA